MDSESNSFISAWNIKVEVFNLSLFGYFYYYSVSSRLLRALRVLEILCQSDKYYQGLTIREENEFDFYEILNEFRSDKQFIGKGGRLAPLIRQLTEATLEVEIELHI